MFYTFTFIHFSKIFTSKQTINPEITQNNYWYILENEKYSF